MFHKRDSSADLAVIKQNGVAMLWKLQSDTIDTIYRCLQADGISEGQANEWIGGLNSLRQVLQDSFLVASRPNSVQEKIKASFEKLKLEADRYSQEAIKLERDLTPQDRVGNLNANFISQFKKLEASGQSKREIGQMKTRLQSQIELFAQTLKRNADDQSLRPNIKEKLLHELVDDYYQEIRQIYVDSVPSMDRM